MQASSSSRRPTPRRASTSYPDKGLYFRTAPSDVLQGKVVANLAVQDGNKNVAVLARQDFYGEGLAESAAKNVEAAGATVPAKVLYNADAENFTAEVNEIAAAKPDALILVAFDETTKIIPQLIAKGLGPDRTSRSTSSTATLPTTRRRSSTSPG